MIASAYFIDVMKFATASISISVNFEATEHGIKYIFSLSKIPSLEYYHVQQISEKDLRKYWKESTSHKNK